MMEHDGLCDCCRGKLGRNYRELQYVCDLKTVQYLRFCSVICIALYTEGHHVTPHAY